MDDSEEDLEQIRSRLAHVKSMFQRKISELGELKDTLEQAKVTKEDINNLRELLADLNTIKQENETVTDDFCALFGSQAPEEAEEADESLEETLVEYNSITLTATRLLLKIERHTAELETEYDNQMMEELDDNFFEALNSGKVDDTKARFSSNSSVVEKHDSWDAETESTGKEDNDDLEDNEERGSSLKMSITKGVVIAILFYCGLGLVINFVLNSQNQIDSDMTTKRPVGILQDDTTCGSEDFMMRDNVCDDPSNIDKCLYDGGDCCLENKDRTLCRECACILEIDHDELKEKFKVLQVNKVGASNDVNGYLQSTQTIQVEDVVSADVCAVLCLEHETSNDINIWQYKVNEEICKCGWIQSTTCPSDMIDPDWTFGETDLQIDDQSIAFVQLAKTVPCFCLADNFLINGAISEMSKVDYPDFPFALSLWHCKQMCSFYKDCSWISWRKYDGENKESAGECRMMSELPQNSDLSTYIMAESNWISSLMNCSTIEKYFQWHSSIGDNYQFQCPNNRMSQGGNESEIIIYLSGGPESFISVFKLDLDQKVFVECGHTLAPPENGLIHATGGILSSNSDENNDPSVLHVIVCGGESVLEGTSDTKPNDRCTVLVNGHTRSAAHQPLLSSGGFLNAHRIGAASLVVDNGNNLWVTGGRGSGGTTEIVSTNKSMSFWTNLVGPSLPVRQLEFHCFINVGQEVAMIIGGSSEIVDQQPPSWSISFKTMIWQAHAPLNADRHKHSCGVLKIQSSEEKLVVAVGGSNKGNNILNSMETLMVTENDEVFADQWEFGPDPPVTIKDAASTTTAGKEELYIIGGTTNNGNSDSILKFHCSHNVMKCIWTIVDMELTTPSSRGLAIMMPSVPMGLRQYQNSRACDKGLEDSESLLIITTGQNGQHTVGDTEGYVFLPSIYASKSSLSICQPMANQTQSMYSISGATGGTLKVNNSGNVAALFYMPVLCGGVTVSGEANDKCYQFDPSGLHDQPKIVGAMRSARQGAASAVIRNDTTLWISGGLILSGIPTETSEMVNVSTTAFTNLSEGIPLPVPMAYHCLEMITEDKAMVFGGVESPRECWTISLTELNDYDGDNQQKWDVSESLIIGRYGHSCGVIRKDVRNDRNYSGKYVVAAGGRIDQGSIITDRVELLKVNENGTIDGFWERGHDLPTPLTDASSVTTENQAVLFLAGGIISYGGDSNDILSKAILSMSCTRGDCEWTKYNQELVFGRSHSVVMMIPPKVSVDFLDEENITLSSVVESDECNKTTTEDEAQRVLLLTTGNGGWYAKDDSEAFIVPSIASHESGSTFNDLSKWQALPDALQSTGIEVEKATAGVLEIPSVGGEDSLWILLLCGGVDPVELETKAECHLLGHGSTMAAGSMRYARAGAASVSLWNRTSLWVTGGVRDFWTNEMQETDTTELINVSVDKVEITTSEGVPLPTALAYHCLEVIDSKTAILYGGSVTNWMTTITRQAWRINVNDSFANNADIGWTSLAPMSVPRHMHSCGVVREDSGTGGNCNNKAKMMVAAGGETKYYESMTSSVEYFSIVYDKDGGNVIKDGTWKEGPKLPKPLMGAASASTEDQTMLFLAGGEGRYDNTNIYYFNVDVLCLKCIQGDCAWTRYFQVMMDARVYAVAMILAPELMIGQNSTTTRTV